MDVKEEFLAHDGCTSERTTKSGSTVKVVDVKVATENPRSVNHSDWCPKQVQSAMRDDAFRAEHIEESKRRRGAVASEPDVVVARAAAAVEQLQEAVVCESHRICWTCPVLGDPGGTKSDGCDR